MKKRLGLLSTAIIAAIVFVTTVLSPDSNKNINYNEPQTAAMEQSASIIAEQKGADGQNATDGQKNAAAQGGEDQQGDADEQTASSGQSNTDGQNSAVGKKNAAGQNGADGQGETATEQGDSAGEIGESACRENCPIKISDTEGIAPDSYIEATVSRVVDGDTIKVEYKGEAYKVRLLCIDTPETVKSGVAEQPYGKKASNKLKDLVEGKKVTLVFEKDTDDNYDRLLAFVMLDDGTCVNALMIAQGYGVVMIVSPNKTYKDYLNGLMQEAIDNKRGLWSLPEDECPFVLNEKGLYKARYIEKDAA